MSHLELDHLRDELHQLARRVDALEHRTGRQPTLESRRLPHRVAPRTRLALRPKPSPPPDERCLDWPAHSSSARSPKSGAVPSILVVSVAILYAATWLVFSVRTREQNAFAGTAYGVTAALIFAPLLWEATVRFHALTPAATAAILVAFLVLCSVLAWSKPPAAVTTVTTLSTLLTAIALMVQTGDLVPFALALLAIAAVIEGAWRKPCSAACEFPRPSPPISASG